LMTRGQWPAGVTARSATPGRATGRRPSDHGSGGRTGLPRSVTLTHAALDETPDWRPGVTPGSLSILMQLRQLKVRSLDPSAFVFGGGSRPIETWDLSGWWRRVLATAKVRYRPPEQLRHTWASTSLSLQRPRRGSGRSRSGSSRRAPPCRLRRRGEAPLRAGRTGCEGRRWRSRAPAIDRFHGQRGDVRVGHSSMVHMPLDSIQRTG